MHRILFIAAHRPNRSPSQRFRFEQYIDFLKQNGFESDFSFLLSEKDDQLFYKTGNYFKKLKIVLRSRRKRKLDLKKINQYDIVFIQREGFMTGSIFFEKNLRKLNKKIIFDFDDSIWLENVSAANRRFNWLKDSSKTSKIIQLSNFIIAGNGYLAEYAKKFNSNVTIIPTTIDTTEYTRIKNKSSHKITIGWSGSITTIQHFKYALPFLKQLKNIYGDKIEIKLIGDENYRNSELNIKGLAWNKENEIDELSSFDIGIMPLPNDEWAKGKCGLKGLQYMALQIPTIMSPVGVNTSIINDGVNGFLASSTNEWVDKISALINSNELRKKIGENARKTVVEFYSVESQKSRYLDLMNKLVLQ